MLVMQVFAIFTLFSFLATVVLILIQHRLRSHSIVLSGVLLVILFIVGIGSKTSRNTSASQPVQQAVAPVIPAKYAEPAPQKKESKSDYIASTKKIGNKKAPIYYKEFLKNPQKFMDQRVNVLGKVMNISEEDGVTTMQAYINDNLDTIIAVYQGSIKIYEDDIVTIYGEGKGTIEGRNRMGAEMSWPAILAKYIVKRADN